MRLTGLQLLHFTKHFNDKCFKFQLEVFVAGQWKLQPKTASLFLLIVVGVVVEACDFHLGIERCDTD